MTSQQAPVALRLAEELEHDPGINRPSVVAELRRLHAENTALQQGYDAARLEIDSLHARVQELGAMLRENRSKRIVELEAQLDAIGAGGVEPLRRRECLHQISEPAPAGEYPALPESELHAIDTAPEWEATPHYEQVSDAHSDDADVVNFYTADQMRAYGEACWKDAYKHAAWGAAQAAPQPAPIFGDEDHVLVPRGLLGAACSAIDKKRDGVKTLADLRRYTTGDLSKAAPQQDDQKPYAYAVYFPDQPTVELVHDLDELTDDLTNREHQITKLYAAPQAAPAAQGDAEDAARYRRIRRGQHWSVIDGIGNELRAEALDAAIDAAIKQGANHD